MTSRPIAIFFYGLFMDADVLRTQGFKPANPRPAEVAGMALCVGSRATLVPDISGSVHGIVMDLTQNHIDRLYADESVASYRPEAVLARLSDGTSIAALCFNLPIPPERGITNNEYREKLREAARKVGLPSHYIDRL
ncbi:MAG: gamma-glutamylcyclotransferase [Acetobacter fabarum]|uniref:gamma-glutamylcyclotransferase family protein n=1 Tax=Acetobacter fabarum TaxID=483199 RepID=UPI0024331E12|nr:gamma-glutamylcyclotransferase family protein [Acetobacter fabarum]MCH4024739.1 gamma-glutamylcyclotransferase [Acetobacter fabarum]MCH4084819.1 gamma-glutamylcyclotransferase [Acetobacter fabarum]MCH4137938.1 gamma-glutamylcyclotransferase [Acetobacter fabarum]